MTADLLFMPLCEADFESLNGCDYCTVGSTERRDGLSGCWLFKSLSIYVMVMVGFFCFLNDALGYDCLLALKLFVESYRASFEFLEDDIFLEN